MTDKIRAYLEHTFADAPQSQKAVELKEELYTNLAEKYNDQIKQGRTETEAYNIVISGIGDISELVDSVRPKPFPQPDPRELRRRAVFTSVAVGLYILSPFSILLFAEFLRQEEIGILVMFLLIAIATGLLIFNHMTRPTYVRTEDTVVEEFKEWRVKNNRQRDVFQTFRGAYWSLVTALYLLLSFLLRIWAFSWIIFIIAAAVENIIRGILQLREDKKP